MADVWRSTRPGPDEYAQFYGRYIARVPDGDIVETLARQIPETVNFLRSIPESRGDHRYGPDKWSIREVIGHISDAERVFAYRALRFSRGDTTPVPGFDENTYVANSRFGERTIEDLAEELDNLRQSNLHLFRGVDEQSMSRRGVANGLEISVRALAFILAGHELHHIEILRARYL